MSPEEFLLDLEKQLNYLNFKIDEFKEGFHKTKQRLYWEIINDTKIICTTSINSHKVIP